MKRRTFLAGMGAAAAASQLPAPALAQSAKSRVLTFVPQTGLVSLDPLTTNAPANANGYYVFDTLYGVDSSFKAHPQMAEGHTVSSDRLTWDIKLRPGLKFHDGERVLAKDCVASIKRWWQRDVFGQSLRAYTDDLSAADDNTLRFRLKKPFELLPDALAHPLAMPCVMMPERLANPDPTKLVTEMVGSGPYKFIANEFVQGQRAVYEKNAAYVPRQDKPEHTAGGKVANFERVEWRTIADAGTAAAALQAGEVDWLEFVQYDIIELLKTNKALNVTTADPGFTSFLRFNSEIPPFNNPAMRRVVAAAISQPDILTALVGDKTYWTECYSAYNCVIPGMDEVGKSLMGGKKDYKALSEEVKKAGYKGEKVVILRTIDGLLSSPAAPVLLDALQKIGIDAEMQNVDLATLFTRRAMRTPIAQGGWSIFLSWASTAVSANPIVDPVQRGIPLPSGYVGNSDDALLESLITKWVEAPNDSDRHAALTKVQERLFEMCWTLQIGMFKLQTAMRSDLTGYLPSAVPVPWNIRRV